MVLKLGTPAILYLNSLVMKGRQIYSLQILFVFGRLHPSIHRNCNSDLPFYCTQKKGLQYRCMKTYKICFLNIFGVYNAEI